MNEPCTCCHAASKTRLAGRAVAGWVAVGLATLCGCTPTPPSVNYQVQELGVITDVLPLAVQLDLARWRSLKPGMKEAEVTALLGKPYRKDPRPTADSSPAVRHLYSWSYGEISFNSFNTKGTFSYAVVFHEGRVLEICDPWEGGFSPGGRPTVPELLIPNAGQILNHYPRFLDFRWQPSSGVYPMEYEVAVQVLEVDQSAAEHYEDYIRKTVDSNQATQLSEGKSKPEMDATAAGFARHLRERQGVHNTFSFRTHDIYLPLTWVGANTGRWRVRAVNHQGPSDWSAWRYFEFTK